jgi:hypothetical protein
MDHFTDTPHAEEHVAETNATADKFREIIEPKLKEAVDKAVKDITDKAYGSIYSTFENDVAWNFGGMVRDRARYIIQGLLNGGWQEAMARKWLYDFDFDEYRKAVYLANHEAIQNQLVDDLHVKIAELETEIAYQKRRNGEFV